jgi:hypothetical protein
MEEAWVLIFQIWTFIVLMMIPVVAVWYAYNELKDRRNILRLARMRADFFDEQARRHFENFQRGELRELPYHIVIGPPMIIYCLDDVPREPMHNWKKEGF